MTGKFPSFWTPQDLDGVDPDLRSAASDLADLFAQIDEVGRNHTDAGETGPTKPSYSRFAWTDEEAWLRVWFAAQTIRRGFDVSVDSAGNQWAWTGKPSAENPGLTIGSHLDSVPGGGAFDGPLGTLSSIAAWDLLNQKGWKPSRPLGIANWHDEEGARFAIACFGSRTLTGVITPQDALSRTDSDGTTYRQALEEFPSKLENVRHAIESARNGLDENPVATRFAAFTPDVIAQAIEASKAPVPSELGPNPEYLSRSNAHVELHVEQGCTQNDLDAPVAVCDKIWPHGRWRIDFDGIPNHAGTTPMDRRFDPMPDFAAFVRAVRDCSACTDARATIGRVEVLPGGVNVIPSHVTCWLDSRADESEKVTALIEELTTRINRGDFSSGLSAADPSHGPDCRIARESWTHPTLFSQQIRDRITDLLDVPTIGTAAGHDAGILAETGHAAGMIFVRNMTGASHTPDEFASLADCAKGVVSYAKVIAELTQDTN